MSFLTKLKDKIKLLESINKKPELLVVQVLVENENIVLDMVFSDQLDDRGIDGDNVPLIKISQYSAKYKAFKASIGVTGRVNLTLTGDHARAGYLKKTKTSIEVASKDEKSPDLTFRWGDAIYKIADFNFVELRDYYVKPEILKQIMSK